jgi:hypothetical protein
VLKVKEQIKEADSRVFVYEMSQSGDVFTIPDPNLKMEELEQVQIEVATLLEHGLPVEGKPWPPEPEKEEPEEPTAETAASDSMEDTEAPESEPTPAAEQVA